MKDRISRLANLLKTLPPKRLLAIAGLLVIAAAIPFTVAVQQIQQNLQQEASSSPGQKATTGITCKTSAGNSYTCPHWFCLNGSGNRLAAGPNSGTATVEPSKSDYNVKCPTEFGDAPPGYTELVTTGGNSCYYQRVYPNAPWCGYVAPTAPPAPTGCIGSCVSSSECKANGELAVGQCSDGKTCCDPGFVNNPSTAPGGTATPRPSTSSTPTPVASLPKPAGLQATTFCSQNNLTQSGLTFGWTPHNANFSRVRWRVNGTTTWGSSKFVAKTAAPNNQYTYPPANNSCSTNGPGGT